MTQILLLVLGVLVVVALAVHCERRVRRQADVRWDAGYLAGLRAGHMAAETLPKPYITQYEERGWIASNRAVVQRLGELVDAELADQGAPARELAVA